MLRRKYRRKVPAAGVFSLLTLLLAGVRGWRFWKRLRLRASQFIWACTLLAPRGDTGEE